MNLGVNPSNKSLQKTTDGVRTIALHKSKRRKIQTRNDDPMGNAKRIDAEAKALKRGCSSQYAYLMHACIMN